MIPVVHRGEACMAVIAYATPDRRQLSYLLYSLEPLETWI
jgi:hypothetical protein